MSNLEVKKFLATLLFSSIAFPCGKGLGEVRLGDKIVSVEIKDSKNKSNWILDDDGMLAISFVAAYCNKSIPYLNVNFSDDQRTCIDNYQYKNNIPFDERVSLYSTSNLSEKQKALNSKLKQICDVDIVETIKKAEDKRNALPISCIDDVKGIINKASKRSEEYFKEQSSASNLARINATEAQKQDFVNKLKADVEVSKEANRLFTKNPITIAEFEKWAKSLANVAPNHGYQVQENPEDKFDPKNQMSLTSILIDVGARVPFLPSSRCGSFPTEIINQLKKAEWKSHSLNSDIESGTQK